MKILAIIAMLISSMFTGQAIAENVWKAPALDNCSAESGAKRKKDCKRMNYCISSSNEGCLAHVGNTGEDQGRSGLLHGCFDRRMHECVGSVRDNSSLSTNLGNNPDAWDCVYNTGKKADPSHCRRVNFCLGSIGVTCNEKIGAKKYTPEGQYKLVECIKTKEIACMRAVD